MGQVYFDSGTVITIGSSITASGFYQSQCPTLPPCPEARCFGAVCFGIGIGFLLELLVAFLLMYSRRVK